MTWFSSGTGGFDFAPESGRVKRLYPLEHVNVLYDAELVDGVAGGDRCWLGPELTHFYDHALEPEEPFWRCPPALDPGTWRQNGEVSILQLCEGAAMTRNVSALHEIDLPSDVAWAGYQVDDLVLSDMPWAP